MVQGARRRKKRAGRRGRPKPAAPPAEVLSPAPASAAARWLPLLLVGAVLVAYLPALGGGFLWDDDAHVTRPDLRSLEGLHRIWSDFGATQQYYPLLHSAFWLEHRLWGNSTVGYHLLNVALHAASACLLLSILRRLEIPGAALVAAVFALHPANVESVAWISEQKNTLSTVFYLGAMHTYLRFDRERRWTPYLLASGLFLLGLLTKTVVATLPGALLVLLWWRRDRLSVRRDVLPLAPWLVIGAGAGLLTAWFEHHLLGAEGARFGLTPLQRALLAGRVAWFYLGKLLWPVDLSFIYPRWSIDASAWAQYLPAFAALVTVATLWAIRRRTRAPLAAALFYLGSLFPALGFVDVYPFVFSFVADHFLYLPSLGVITGVAAGMAAFAAGRRESLRRLALLGGVALPVVLGALTWRQSSTYADSRTLYEATLARNPECYLCLNNLGTMAVESGRLQEAVQAFRGAVQIKPDSSEAHNNLANVLVQAGALAEGIEQYRAALQAAPNNVIARTNLGSALFLAGRIPEARQELEKALSVMPDYEPARQKLSVIDALQRHPPESAASASGPGAVSSSSRSR